MVWACIEKRRRIVQWRLLIRNIDPTHKWEMMPKTKKKKNIIVPHNTKTNAIKCLVVSYNYCIRHNIYYHKCTIYFNIIIITFCR